MVHVVHKKQESPDVGFLERSHFVEVVLLLGSLVPVWSLLQRVPYATMISWGLQFVTSTLFVLAFLFGKENVRHHHLIILAGFGVPGIVAGGALKQLHFSSELQIAYALFWMLSMVLGALQGVGKTKLPSLFDRRWQRWLSLPWVLMLAMVFKGGVEYVFERMWQGDGSVGFFAFLLLGILPLLFAYMLVVPTSMLEQREADLRDWAVRYGVLLGGACVSAFVFSFLGV